MQIVAAEYGRLKEELVSIFMKHTGQERERLIRDMDRDFFLTPAQAVEYGLIDAVLVDRKIAV